MSIDTSSGCGVHCGITAGREGHCNCRRCHDGQAPVVTLRELTAKIPRIPMCELKGTGYHREGRP